MKNKTIIPFNFKAFIYIFVDLFLLIGSIVLCIKFMFKKDWIITFGCIFCITFFILGLLVYLLKNIKFKDLYIVLPKEFGINGKPQTECKLYYHNISKIKYIKRDKNSTNLEKPKFNAIMFVSKDNKTFLFSTNFCSNKQINNILIETKKRCKLIIE